MSDKNHRIPPLLLVRLALLAALSAVLKLAQIHSILQALQYNFYIAKP